MSKQMSNHKFHSQITSQTEKQKDLDAEISTSRSVWCAICISSFISYFMLPNEERLFSLDLVTGIVTTLTGSLIYLYRMDLINVFPVILGIWIIVSNLIKMQLSINLSAIAGSNWFLLLITQILMIILGVVLITNPFSSLIALTTLAGSFLIIAEVASLIESIYILVKLRNL